MKDYVCIFLAISTLASSVVFIRALYLGYKDGEITIDQLFDMAKHGTLPKSFKDWHLTKGDGITVAHVAAEYGNIPIDFDQWDLVDNRGITVHTLYTNRLLQKAIEELRGPLFLTTLFSTEQLKK